MRREKRGKEVSFFPFYTRKGVVPFSFEVFPSLSFSPRYLYPLETRWKARNKRRILVISDSRLSSVTGFKQERNEFFLLNSPLSSLPKSDFWKFSKPRSPAGTRSAGTAPSRFRARGSGTRRCWNPHKGWGRTGRGTRGGPRPSRASAWRGPSGIFLSFFGGRVFCGDGGERCL